MKKDSHLYHKKDTESPGKNISSQPLDWLFKYFELVSMVLMKVVHDETF